MLAAAKNADVVIVNPTHYAIALRYDEHKDEVPKVIAKGVNTVAIKIIKIANTNDIPVIQNAPLARSLHVFTQVDSKIPEELYMVVAEILAYVWKMRRSTPIHMPNKTCML